MPRPRARRVDESEDSCEIEDPSLRHGYAVIPGPIMRARELQPSAKVLYGLLRSYALNKGECFPSQARLAWDLDASIRNVQLLLKSLQRYGLIDWHERFVRKDGVVQRRGNLYVIRNWAADPRYTLARYPNARVEDDTAVALVSPENTPVSQTDLADEKTFAPLSRAGEVSFAHMPEDGERAFATQTKELSHEEYPVKSKAGKSTRHAALWSAAQEELRSRVSSALFEAFVRPAKAEVVEEAGVKYLLVQAPSTYVCEQLENRVGPSAFAAAYAILTNEWLPVRFAGPAASG